jgi:UPF0755 protein
MSFYHSLMRRKFQGRALFAKQINRKSWRFYGILLITLVVVLYSIIFLWQVVPSIPNTKEGAYKVKIAPQSGINSISGQLSEQGISSNAIFFQIAARSLFVGGKLKPGTYLLAPRASLGNILLQIARGDRVRESLAIIPGMTIWLLEALNLSYPGAEGLFYPDTYIFDPDDTDISIYKRASQAMQKQLNSVWAQRSSDPPLKTPYELLILASIIEKETGRSSDRSLVSAVFINRLNLKMPLQTDPTVIYGIGPRFDGNLRKTDLRKDTPYNTYMRKDLPPTPIAMPSKESLQAAIQPAKSDAIYFVARGDGSSHFSKTLKEHENAIDQFQRKRSASSKTNSQ